MMKRLLFLFLLLATGAYGQTLYRYENILINQNGTPVVGANVWVCSGNVTPNFGNSPPCTLATIYSDLAGTLQISQPIISTIGSAIQAGSFAFVVATGTYTLAIKGAGLQASDLITVPNVAGTTTATNLAGPGTVTGTYTHSGGVETFTSTVNCKQIEGTLCIDSANTQGWSGADFGARLASAIAALPSNANSGGNNYANGTIWVKNDAYTMSSPITITSPFVTINCESGATITYTGAASTIPFTFTATPFNYEGTGGMENCRLIDGSGGWSAGVQLKDVGFLHFRNTNIQGNNTASAVCMLYNAAANYSEEINLDRVSMSQCSTTIEMENTGGTGSFSYGRWRQVELSPIPGSGNAAIRMLGNTNIGGGALEFNAFVGANTPALWLSGTSRIFSTSQLSWTCETAGGSPLICLKTDTGTTLQANYTETIGSGSFTDSIAASTLIPYSWNYAQSGLSQGQAVGGGILLQSGTGSGYACGASCGALTIGTNTQTNATFPSIQAPANLGNNSFTMLLVPSGGTTHSLVQTASGVSGCTTAASLGGICSTPITVTWGSSFFDTTYAVSCSPSGTATNLPSAPYIASKAAGSITVNYFANSASAASWATIDCIAIHQL